MQSLAVEMLLQKAAGIMGGGPICSCGGALVVAGAGPQPFHEVLPHQSHGFHMALLPPSGSEGQLSGVS